MAGRYAQATIAGVALQGAGGVNCRVDVLDGEGLKRALVGSSVVALDFTVHTQLSSRGAAGVPFGLRVAWMPITLLNSVVEVMEAALQADEDFVVTASDSGGAPKTDDISVRAVPDFRAMAGKYFTRGELSNDYVKDVVFRFISTGAAGS